LRKASRISANGKQNVSHANGNEKAPNLLKKLEKPPEISVPKRNI
jgi:hypothetical protein